ncbi:MAG TPA: BamA/TamA family outer membrane protein [Gemmatimonadota bacterium]|nr:BamA/TamA family outer membrane protein [Gemmatimonadota bacterium]
MTFLRAGLLALVASVLFAAEAHPQYFGRNKVQYERFEWRVLETEHFDLHGYETMSDAALTDVGRMAERWYDRYEGVFEHQFRERKPLILYADKPDFQQTNTTPGFVSQSTGGFTEGLKDRIVLPFAEGYGETDHVLGHELVHAFQFDVAKSDTAGGPTGFLQLPLWFIEGMAEYLSLGRVSAHTAMWMRDAVERGDLPTLDDLSRDPSFFPYRFGHAFWAYVAGTYGDDTVRSLLQAAGQGGIDGAIEQVLRTSADSLSRDWIETTRAHWAPTLGGRTPAEQVGEPLFPEMGDDDWVLAPSISPDGRRVVFLSNRDLFTIDLYVGDVATGDILGRLASNDRNPHFDAIAFLNSSGAWSRDGSRFAFVTFARGDNGIAIADVGRREVDRTLALDGVDAVFDLAWSPDGTALVVSGTRGGIVDLYRVDVASGAVERLTEGAFAELAPTWSPDGRTIAFVTDRAPDADLGQLRPPGMGLGFYDIATRAVRVERPLGDAKHISPQYAPDGRSLYFISDPDGFSDIYRLDLASEEVFRVTRVTTGISGITQLAPALSVARDTGRLAFSVFRNGGYRGATLPEERAVGTPAGRAASPPVAAVLPPATSTPPVIVAEYLSDPGRGLTTRAFEERPYESDLSLDYVAPPTAGVAIDRFGTSVGGSIGFFFGDLLGNRQLALGVQANGGPEDLGGVLTYANLENRLNWGWVGGRQTYRSVLVGIRSTEFQGAPAREVVLQLERTYYNRAGVFAQYPFSTTRRIEGEAAFMNIGFDVESIRSIFVGNQQVAELEEDLPAPDGLNLGTGSFAYVEDYSFFGFTSPVRGGRSRFEVGVNAGTLTFADLLLDWRRYFFARPVTFAVRGFHLGRYGGDAESTRLTPLFVGYPTLIRGYESGSFEPSECTAVPDDPAACPEFDRLIGSRIGIANAELRVPLFGTEEYGLLGAGFLPIELAGFVDGAVAWNQDESPEFELTRESTERIPVFSAGGALRFNLFGAIVAELYYAYPFQRPDEGWRWGFQLAPGW